MRAVVQRVSQADVVIEDRIAGEIGQGYLVLLGIGTPEQGNRLYEYFVELAKATVPQVETGKFGADMRVSLINDGPFTIVLDTDTL